MKLRTIMDRKRWKELTKFLLRVQSRCQICQKKARDTHHIIPLNYDLENEDAIRELEELHTPGNLLVVCPKCHKRIHGNSGCFKKGKDARRKIQSKAYLRKMQKIRWKSS